MQSLEEPRGPRDTTASMAAPVLVPAPIPEDPMVEKLLQGLVAENQRRQPAPVIPAEPVGLEKLLQSYLSGQKTSRQQSHFETTVSVETRQAGLE